ncbi:MAG: SIS domain-containing protein, partial [Candidatus Omnitrophota bacterium]
AKIIAIASGGKLIARARRDGVPHLLVPAGFPPRAAVGYLFFVPYILLRRLVHLGLKKDEFQEMLRTLRMLKAKKMGPEVPVSRNLAKRLALRLYGNLPAIHGSVRIDTVVTRWRTQIAENSKQLSWSHFYPELNHNEIVGWREPKSLFRHLVILLLRDEADGKQVQKRMDITTRLIRQETRVETVTVRSSGRALLSRLFSLIYIGDFVSFYLGILNRVDPTPVERIERLKKELARR